MRQAIQPGEVGRNNRLSALRSFSGFRPETERRSLEPEVNMAPVQALLLKAFEAWKSHKGALPPECGLPYSTLLPPYDTMLRDHGVSARDIANFCISLPRLKADKNDINFEYNAGLFLTSLINISNDPKFELYLEHLEKPLYAIGCRNRKEIIIYGNGGESLGDMMSSGSITVEGSCGDYCGFSMSGGKISIRENCGGMTGALMSGGEIRVGGRIASVDKNIIGGRIFEGGRLVAGGVGADG